MSVSDSTHAQRAAHRPGAAATWPATPWTPLPDAGESRRRRTRRRYRRDQLIAAVAAAGLHVGVLFGFNNTAPEPPLIAKAPAEETIRLEMPALEPPERIDLVDVDDTPAVPQLAPPALLDIPSVVPVSSLTQPMRPTLDPSLTSVGLLTIPSVTAPSPGAQNGGLRLFDLKDLDRVPRRLKTVLPEYPHEMRRTSTSGEVVLIVIINTAGRVEVERVVSATNPEFEAAAVRAAEQCVFEAPLRGGQHVNARYRWEIPFEIN